MISVLILTRNEEQDLPGCLRSVAWSDDVWVFDSHSTDATVQVAEAHGAQVVQRPFDNYAAQRNAALDALPFRHDWIFLLDADEHLSPELYTEMRDAAAAAPVGVAGFRLRRRDHFLGRWLKHAQTTPFYIRLVRRGRARYAREINEVLVVDGKVRDLAGAFDHYPFSKGLTHWIAKHNSYASGEAKIVAEQTFQADASWKTALFAKDFNRKHSARKAIFYRMPGRPLVRWAYLMFYRGGILDGHAGFVYSTLQAIYEYFIVLKTEELRAAARARKETMSENFDPVFAAPPDAPKDDPGLIAPFSLRNRIGRQLWSIVYVLLYRPSPRPMHAWRALLLKAFGARLGDQCHFYAKGKVWAPWNLVCEDRVSLADDAELYNPAPMHFGSHAIVSQGAYVCGATHTYNDPKFPLVSFAMRFGAYSWICARAIVAPGVQVGEGAILGLGSIATKNLEPYGIYAGAPARKVKERERSSVPWV